MLIKSILFLNFICFNIIYARNMPSYDEKGTNTATNFYAKTFIFAKLVLIVAVIWVCWMLSVRRSSRPIKSNTLHTEMVSDVLAYKKYTYKTKQVLKRAISKKNSAHVNNRRQVLLNETRVQQAAHKAKLKERSAEESVLPPPTRDVKRFVESMADECEMEACTVRRTM